MENEKVQLHKKLVSSMYHYLASLKSITLNKKDLVEFYTKNIEVTINNSLVARDRNELYEHFKLMASKPCEYSLVFSDHPMIAEDNRLAIQYQIEMRGEKKEILYTMLFFTFSNNKISKWEQVVSKASAEEMELTDN